MSEPEVKFEIDEHGRIGYRVTNEGVLLSKDEKEFIIDHVTRMQAENAKLRELVADMWPFVEGAMDDEYCPAPECPFTELCTENQVCMASSGFHYRMRELGVEV